MGLTAVLGFIKGIFKPAADLVDNIHTSKEEKLGLLNELADIEFQMQAKVLEYETKVLEISADVINTEGKGNWLQRSWRPLLMLIFAFLILYRYFLSPVFGWPAVEFPEKFWNLLTIGTGGYVVGRSLEKIAPQFGNQVSDILKRKRQ